MRVFLKVSALSFVLLLLFLPNSYAAPKAFKNCSALNKVYPGGVAKPGAINLGGVTKNEPKYDLGLYKANKKSDRDGDGIACEK